MHFAKDFCVWSRMLTYENRHERSVATWGRDSPFIATGDARRERVVAEVTRQSEIDAVARAHSTIAHQAEELDRLRRRLAEAHAAEELLAALSTAVAAGTIAASVTHGRVLEMIVETAADVIGARSAALFTLDETSDELVFEVALGPKAAEVKQFRVPLGHGIAGLVAVSAQPMAVADVATDERQASDIAEAIGYMPQSIVCVPLIYADRVIGVLELLDKAGAPSFSAADIHTLGLFANQAAVAIEQSQAHRSLSALLASLLQPIVEASNESAAVTRETLRAFAARAAADDPHFGATIELAELVREIVWQGELERRTCLTILRGFASYLRQRPQPGGPGGMDW
jgi:GAF domain-containing protein